jgi:hypothetical protein
MKELHKLINYAKEVIKTSGIEETKHELFTVVRYRLEFITT